MGTYNTASMMIDVHNLENEKVGEVNLPEAVFARKWNPALVHQALVAQMANARKPRAHAKGRGEVRGGGRKPWRQKGTGRARHGSIRSPIWVGGGVAHGPTKEKVFAKKINKKMKRAALFTVLSKKVKEHDLKVIDALHIEAPKTRVLAHALKKLRSTQSVLLIPALEEKNVYRAAANLKEVKSLDPRALNVYDLMRYKHIFMDTRAIETVAAHYRI